MFNILLDKFPTTYENEPINSDFRVGIQLFQASQDEELSDYEKLEVCSNLLFVNPQTDAEFVGEGIKWFLSGYNRDNHKSEGSSKVVMDFDIDAGRIYSAFLSQYRIDLNVEDMHFWKFMYLLANLEECSFNRVIDIRQKVIDSKMSAEERKFYTKMKKAYAINKVEELTAEEKAEEQEALAIFQKFAGVK